MGYHAYYSGEVSVTPPLSEDDAAVVRAFVNLEQTELTQSLFAAIAASEEPDLPWYGSLLDVSEDRASLVPEEGESNHGVRLWLRLLVEHFLAPKGYVVNGEFSGKATVPTTRAASTSRTIRSRLLTTSPSMPSKLGSDPLR
jgi:hypothetical protein